MEKIDFIDVAEHPLTVLLEKNYLKIFFLDNQDKK